MPKNDSEYRFVDHCPHVSVDPQKIAVYCEQCKMIVFEAPREVERIWCMECGKSVSTEVPKGTIVRAWVECPECIEKKGAPRSTIAATEARQENKP